MVFGNTGKYIKVMTTSIKYLLILFIIAMSLLFIALTYDIYANNWILGSILHAQTIENLEIANFNIIDSQLELDADLYYKELEIYYPNNVFKYIDSYGIEFYSVICDNNCIYIDYVK